MTTAAKCSICGEALAGRSVEGLCLKCLARVGFASATSGDGSLRLGDFDLLGEISRGGMGVIYQARQRSLNRLVALKVVLQGPFANPEFVRRFQTEAEAAASLKHPNIVPVYEIGESQGQHYLAMELIEGANFADLTREKPLPAKQAAGYVEKIALALQYAHERGVLHRDLKPSNVLLDAFDQPRVTDFGLAKLMHQSGEITLAGQVFGSPNHMPPEQASGRFSESTVASDVYSMGSILYQLLTGRPPFEGGSLQEILLQVQSAVPVSPRLLRADIPADLETICLKCLQKGAAQRYQTAADLAADLNAFLCGKPIQARPVGLYERIWLWSKRRPVYAGLSLALAAVALLGVAGIVWQWRRAEAHAQGESALRLVAEANAREMRLNLYAADVNSAAQAIHSDNFGLARRLLENLAPQPGEADLRGFEWRYLRHRCEGDELAALTGHEWIVTDVDYSPDGQMLASSSMDGTARLWDAANHECLRTLALGKASVMAIRFTPDGKFLLTAGVEGMEMRDTSSWKMVRRFPARLLAMAAGGQRMATSDSSPFYYEKAGEIVLWNWATGEKLRTFERPGHGLALSPDGHRLAVARTTADVDLYDADSGETIRVLHAPNPVWQLNFSPDGRRLLTAGWSSNAMLWQVDDASPPRPLTGHHLTVWSAVFSPDGKLIATTGSDQTIRLWDAETLRQTSEFHGHSSEVWCARFSPDGSTLATGSKDCSVKLWPARRASSARSVSNYRYARPVFLPDGKKILTLTSSLGPSQLWQVENQALEVSSVGPGLIAAGVDAAGRNAIAFDPAEMTVILWDVKTRTIAETVPLKTHSQPGTDFPHYGCSPEGDFLFAEDRDGLVQIWNTQSGDLSCSIQGPAPPLRNIVLGPHGRHLLASVERESFAHLYDCQTREEFRLEGHRDFVSGLAFSPDGQMAATGSMDGGIRLWRTARGEFAAALPGHIEETTDVAFSPDGRTLASLGHLESLKLWHLPTLREVFSESIPSAGTILQFSPDGHWLAVNTEDDRVLLLNAP